MGYPLQYSGLENSMDGMDSQSQTQLSDFHFHFSQLGCSFYLWKNHISASPAPFNFCCRVSAHLDFRYLSEGIITYAAVDLCRWKEVSSGSSYGPSSALPYSVSFLVQRCLF